MRSRPHGRTCRRTLAIAVAAFVAVTVGATPAMAADVGGADGGNLRYVAAPGETNVLRVVQTGLTVVFDDAVTVTTSNPACVAADDNVTCTVVLPGSIDIDLNDLDDSTTLTGVSLATFQVGGAGSDVLGGGGAGDTFVLEPGSDTYAGGDGFDTVFSGLPGAAVSVTLDNVANDGAAGESDNVGADIEDVFHFESDPITIVGSAAANVLVGEAGADTIDGGPGNDLLDGQFGDDTLRARDGFADRVACGGGSDTAVVDTLDAVDSCETIDRANVGNANDVPEDRPPALAFLSPAPNALVPASGMTATFSALDDRGIASVQLIDDGRAVGADATAPYAIGYLPRGEDVGSNTLVAIATDTAGQTATAIRPVQVARFDPRQLTARVTPSRDRVAPYRFRTSGTLTLPGGVTEGQGCSAGVVSVQVKRGATTLSTRRANLRRNCTYSSSVTFTNRRRLGSSGRLRFTARFLGNAVLTRETAPTRTARAG